MVVAVADHVGAGLDQQPDDGEVGGFRREMQRIGVVAGVADAHVGAAFEQQLHAGALVAPCCLVQRRLPLEIAAAGVDQVRVAVEQAAQLVGVAFLRRLENAVDHAAHVRWGGLALLMLARQQLDRLVAVFLGDLMHGPALRVGQAGIEAGLDGAANRIDVAGGGCRKHLVAQGTIDARAVDMRLELPPAGKAVVARKRELGRGELCGRIGGAQRLEALLGFVLQVFEIGLSREFADSTGLGVLAHEIPSFLVPSVRGLGQEVRFAIVVRFGGLSPSRGPLASVRPRPT